MNKYLAADETADEIIAGWSDDDFEVTERSIPGVSVRYCNNLPDKRASTREYVSRLLKSGVLLEEITILQNGKILNTLDFLAKVSEPTE